MKRSLTVLAMLLSLAIAGPAAADSTTPTMDFPLSRVGDTADVEVMLQAPLKSWGIRRAAKFYDRQVDGLTIHTRGTCAARPLAVCVRVFVKAYSAEEALVVTGGTATAFHGATIIPSNPDGTADQVASREIHLNTTFGKTQTVAFHELGHAIGLSHHDGVTGVMGTAGWEEFPSTAELDTLRAWYSVPRA